MGGVFGVVSRDDCVKTLFYGTDYHSHLGTENAGLAVIGKDGFQNITHSISQAQFKSRFIDDTKKIKGNFGIGTIDDESLQPLVVKSKFGTYAIAASGMITNKDSLTKDLMLNEGVSFTVVGSTINSIEIVSKLINRGESIVDGIQIMMDALQGSMCTLIMTADGIYAARDKFGRFPLAIGEKSGAGEFVVATEASSFPNLGYDTVRFLGPGEIVLLSPQGLKVLKKEGNEKKVCAFLWIYTGDPSSSYDGISVENARERCGMAIAKNDDVNVDFVTGIPDSGIGHAIGYAIESRIPYRRPLIKYTSGYGRSYTPPSQEIRDLVATMKLFAIKEIIKGSRIVVCDDSIVRGTQLKNFTIKKLWDNGAKELHVRPACPPLLYPCIYMVSTRSTLELASRRAIRAIEGNDVDNIEEYLDIHSNKYKDMVEWIRKEINVTSLKYLSIEDMVSSIGLPEEQLCMYCWRGH